VLRVVVDTNVFVSSLLNKTGSPARVVDAWRSGEYLLVTSPSIIAEIEKVVALPRIRKKYALAVKDIQQLIDLLEKETIIVSGLSHIDTAIADDPTDQIFLSWALDAGADAIVSGDRHLLNLEQFEGIPIMTVQNFLARLVEHMRT
jgi:hypothetical protein